MSKQNQLTRKREAAALDAVGRWQDRIAEALVILLLCVQPLYLNPSSTTGRYIRLTGHKFNFFAWCMGAVICAVLAVKLFRWLSALPNPSRGKLSVADWAVLGLAAVTLLSALFSPYSGIPDTTVEGYNGIPFTKRGADVWLGIQEPNGRYDGAITQLFYIAAFFIISRWYKPRERDFIIFGASAVLVSLIGIFQFYGMDFLKLWPNDLMDAEGVKPFFRENFFNIPFRSTLGNINIVSTYVCVAVLLCGFLFVRAASTSKWRYIWLTGSGLTFWLMILASSYSGMVGVLLTTFIALPFIIERRDHLGRFLLLCSSWAGVFTLQKLFYDVRELKAGAGSVVIFAGAAIVLLAGGLALTVYWKGPNTVPDPNAPVKWKLGVIMIAAVITVGLAGVEVLGRREDVPVNRKDAVYQAREILHGNIADEFGTNRVYIWRIALENFYKHPVLGSGPDTFTHVFPNEAQMRYGEAYDKAHNEYIQILICQGILGLLCYLAFLGALFSRSVPGAFKNPLLMATLAAFTGYCIQAFFNINLPIASQMLWVMAGMMACKGFYNKAAPAE